MGLCFVDHGAGVRPSRITYDRADSLFAADAGAFDWGALAEQASWFHLSGITLALSDAAASAACAAVDAMRERGVPVSFDGNYRPSLWLGREAEAGRLYRFMAEAADVLFGSAHDIGRALGRELSGDSNQGRREAAEAAFEGFPNISVIASTRREICPGGGQHLGARVDGRKEGFETELAALGPIMDRIGSGDAFAGAVIDCLLRREPIERCARMGLAAAALKHSVAGDRWIGSRDDLERFDPNAGSDLQR